MRRVGRDCVAVLVDPDDGVIPAAENMHFRYGRAVDSIPRLCRSRQILAQIFDGGVIAWRRLITDIAVGLPAHCVGVNEVGQPGVCGPADLVMSTATVYPGVAPLGLLRPIYDESNGSDGFASIEWRRRSHMTQPQPSPQLATSMSESRSRTCWSKSPQHRRGRRRSRP